MKRPLSAALSLFLCVALCGALLAACAPETTPATTEQPVTTEESVTSEAPTEPPITSEDPATETEVPTMPDDPTTAPTEATTVPTEATTAPTTVKPTTAKPTTVKTTAKPTTRSPYSENAIEFYGRFKKSADGWRFDWSGSTIEAGFEGTGVEMQMNLIMGSKDYFNIYIDGGEPTMLTVENTQDYYTLASGLKKGYHTVRVEKRTEGGQGALCEFCGFNVKGGKLTKAPARPVRTIEVVGDSITAAYGNMAPGNWGGFKLEEENFGQSYGKFVADEFGASVTVLGWSGGGMFQDLGGNRGSVFSNDLYWRTIAHDSGKDFKPTFQPDVMIINLGTNDFQFNTQTPREDFNDGYLDAYEEFIRTVRKDYPDTHIVMCIGPINQYAYESLETIQSELAGEGDTNISVLLLTLVDLPSDERWGGDGHPSVAGHRSMADQLIYHIGNIMDW